MLITPEVLEGAIAIESTVKTSGKEKISKPPPIIYFLGIKPIPKEEGYHDQWEFQVRVLLVGFIGYLADINLILSEVSNRFSKKYSGDKLQQEFYQMKQHKGEKIRVFVSQLEQTYRRLRERLPGRFDEAQSKDRLFHQMLQMLHHSMRFLYKDPHVNYCSLLESTKETEDEVGEAQI